jgi:hypothetical protein
MGAVMRAIVLAVFGLWMVGTACFADPARLYQLMHLDELIEVMHEEGERQGQDLAQELFTRGATEQWQAQIARIYDVKRMQAMVRDSLVRDLQGQPAEVLVGFYSSDLGQKMIAHEIEARRAMVDPAIEQAARDTYQTLLTDDHPRTQLVARFIASGDLLERNLSSALNSTFHYYRGLRDGGALEGSEQDLLRDVWAQEGESRADIHEWLYGFLLLAAQPFSDAELTTYVTAMEGPQGRRLNQALFVAFDAMYNDISYALGLLSAKELMRQDL